jgi:hypothetical protein
MCRASLCSSASLLFNKDDSGKAEQAAAHRRWLWGRSGTVTEFDEFLDKDGS